MTATYALGLFILGMMSKSVIATLPMSLLAVFWWKRGKISWKNDVIPLIPFFAAGIAYGLFTAWVERAFIGAEGGAFTFTIIERCLIAGRTTWFYLSKIFVPMNLMFMYPRWNVSQTVWRSPRVMDRKQEKSPEGLRRSVRRAINPEKSPWEMAVQRYAVLIAREHEHAVGRPLPPCAVIRNIHYRVSRR